jgi:ABC-type transporter Mla subunit MlaD
LRGITGYSGLLPSLPTGDAAKAEQKLETFKGKIKALGRTIASQQGKLGNMAVQEWQMVSDAVQAIKPTAGNLDEQMRDVVRQAKQLSKNMQDKFDLTYEGEAPAAPAAPAAGALSPAEQAELAQLRKRFGK